MTAETGTVTLFMAVIATWKKKQTAQRGFGLYYEYTYE